MSFQTLKKELLLQVAEDFAVDVDKDNTKAEIIAALEQDGVTWAMYKQAYPSELDQPDAENNDEPEGASAEFTPTAKTVLMKMTRGNGTFQIRGYKFTREHPFLPVKEDDANYILENVEGFKIASPKEAEDFYS